MTDKLSPSLSLEAHAYLAAIIASSDDAIISKDLNGNITSWNPSAERIFGYLAAEAFGKHISLIIPADSMSEEDYILGQVKQGKRVDHFETLRRRKNGTMVNISVTVSPIKNKDGVIIGASKVARDISDRIVTEKLLLESNQKKDEFLANMSHELRTPMNAVIGLSNILKGMNDLPEKARKYVDTLKNSADNLMDLINDLLDFAKIEAGSLEIEEIEFNLPERIEKLISVSNVKAKEKNIALYVNYAPSLKRYYIGDPLRISQILSNLVSNAIKFTDKGSVEMMVTGRVDKSNDSTMLTIRIGDTGIGIPPEKLEVIFDKFSQADSSITRRFGGSGLGLAIAKACVEKMNGSISVESEVGIGTVFTVVLPLKNTDKVSEVESFSATSTALQSGLKKNILLVEDYEPNIVVASAMLDNLGYDYDVTANGFDAIRKFVNGKYDVILMDVQMSELDGLEATRRIRQMEKDNGLQRTPIIAMTAHVRDQDKDKCFEAGMDDFISKPFELAILSQKIERFMLINEKISQIEKAAKT